MRAWLPRRIPSGTVCASQARPESIFPLSSAPSHHVRARRGRWRWLALTGLAVAAIALPALVAAGEGRPEAGADPAPLDLEPATQQDPSPDGGDEPGVASVRLEEPAEPEPEQLARIDDVVLMVPGHAPVVVGYHEASSAEALEMQPLGQLIANRNPTKYDAPGNDEPGADYLVLASRDRPFPATSAVDVVLLDDDPVLSPATGTISDVRSYYLYGQHLDHRLEITPDNAPHLRVVLVHIDDVVVQPGDRVVAGRTTVAGAAMRFPFLSQIDRETEPAQWPHVHIEVKHQTAVRPGDGSTG